MNIADGDTWFARFINGAAPKFVYNSSLEFNEFPDKTATFTTDEWVSFKFEATQSNQKVNLWLYLNDTVYAVFETTSSLQNITLTLSSWNMYPSVRNICVKGQPTEVAGLEELRWNTGGWTESEENGETVYTNSEWLNTITRVRNNGEYNTFSFDTRLNNLPADLLDCNVSAVIKLNATDNYMFEYNPANSRRYARLRYFDAAHAAEGIELGKVNIDIAPSTEWVNIKVVFERDYLSFYINDERVITHFDTGKADFSKAQATVSVWQLSASVKNLEVSNTEKDYDGVSYVDFEFKKSLAAEVFDATNGDVSWIESGALALTVTGADPVLASPVIDVSQGSAYSAKLSVRNTFVVRLKNNTAADKLTLSYVTAVNGDYDGVKQKTFDIEPNSGYKTYYFNISDVADCGHWASNAALRACKCFLRGFKFTFVGATSGDVEIDAITFEREDRIYEKAATELTCVADKTAKTVTVSGTLLDKYAGKTVIVYESPIQNYNEMISYADVKRVASGAADENGEFEITFPLVRENGVSHLSTTFLAGVEGNKLGDAFMIENWRDFSENPYAFELPDLTVNATDAQFGAKGDGFTNDNAAIQAAIDYVSAQGGGTVVLPGEPNSAYGRRYVASQLNMKSNVELRIEKGAVLWQSSRLEDYDYGDYEPVYGHDVFIAGVPWTHAAVSWNLPFIYVNEAQNVRVTGGGEIRMQDTGTQWLDGNGYTWDSEIAANCESVIHIHPIGVNNSTGVEISDVTVKRSSIWHMPISNSSDIYCGNIELTEVSCINGDGISFMAGTRNAIVDRCTLYSNDDAIVLSAFYDDPRGYGKAWWQSHPDDFSGVANITVTHSNMFGGHGITFITWGSDNPVAVNSEIENIRVTDNVLGGYTTAVGAWTDNPYYGESKLNTYDQRERNDYSPIRDIYIVGNIYTAPTLLGTWDGDTPELAPATNAVTDCDIFSPSQFVNGTFDKTLRYAAEQTWTTGLSYWTSKPGDNGEVGTEKVGTKQAAVGNTTVMLTIDDYAAFVKGVGELYQGLYLTFGGYEFNVDVKLVSGSAKLFARNAVTGDIIAQQDVTSSEQFQTVKLAFSLVRAATVQLGIMHTGEEDEIVYIDNASIVTAFVEDMFDVDGEKYTWTFDNTNGFVPYDPKVTPLRVSGGMLVTDSAAEYKIMLDQTGKLTEFDMSVDIILTGGMPVDAGLYLFATDVAYATDKITAYNVEVEYSAGASSYVIKLFRFSTTGGYLGKLIESEPIVLSGSKIHLRTVVKNGTLFVFADGADEYAFSYALPEGLEGGNVGLRSQCMATRFDNFTLISAQYVAPVGNRTELNESLALAGKFPEFAYTEQSYAALKSAIEEANALSANATQDLVDAVKAKVDAAIAGLQVEEPKTPEQPEQPEQPEPVIKVETVTVTKTVKEKDIGMTVGFYVVLGLLIAGIAAAAVVIVRYKKNLGKKDR